jgi:GNAT superfamily N-acetyltransferase
MNKSSEITISSGPGASSNSLWLYADDCHDLNNIDSDKRYSAVGITKYATHWYVHNMFVVEKHRGRGIGSQLLSAVLAHWKRSAIGRRLPIMLDAQPYDLITDAEHIERLRRFYMRHGFVAYCEHPYAMYQVAASENDISGPITTVIELARAAVKWWRMHRPDGWSEAEHLKNPCVNANSTERSSVLAKVVARYVSSRKQNDT